jgi:hypothetical protein
MKSVMLASLFALGVFTGGAGDDDSGSGLGTLPAGVTDRPCDGLVEYTFIEETSPPTPGSVRGVRDGAGSTGPDEVLTV